MTRHFRTGAPASSGGGAIVAAFLACSTLAHAQIRLDDIFTSSTLAGEKPPANDEAQRLDATLTQMKAALASGDVRRVKSETERLLSLLDKADPRYLETVYLRAEAFSLDPDHAQVRALAVEYLRLAPAGEHARWFNIQLAHEHAAEQRWELAADAWRFASESPGGPLKAGEALHAVEAMGQAGRATELRNLLMDSRWQTWPPAERDRAELWLLDSLLIQDDPGAFPQSIQPKSPQALARFILLMRLRHEPQKASRAMDELTPRRNSLNAAELRSVLESASPSEN